jgi:hypothetical protein
MGGGGGAQPQELQKVRVIVIQYRSCLNSVHGNRQMAAPVGGTEVSLLTVT